MTTHTIRRMLTLAAGVALLGAIGACSEQESGPEPASDAELPPAPASNPLTGGAPGPAPAAPPTPDGDRIEIAGVVFTPPETWVSEQPGNAMRRAQFRVPAPEGSGLDDAQLTVFELRGGIDANLDRWAGQFSDLTGGPDRAAVTRDGLEIGTLFVEGGFTVGPMMGGDGRPQPGTALLGAVIVRDGRESQLKLVGPAGVIAAHRDAWDAMIDAIEPAE